MRTRHPFADVELGYEESPRPVTLSVDHERGIEVKSHPDAVVKGAEMPLGFMPHRAENRKTRRAAVANWQPPKAEPTEGAGETETPAPVAYPTRRDLWKQRQKQRRGKLDPELRAAQRKAGAK